MRGDRPTWFVPTTADDWVLQDWPDSALKGDLRVRRFLEGLPGEPPFAYTGRDQVLGLDHLRELWFHLTNRCNQACRHCRTAVREFYQNTAQATKEDIPKPVCYPEEFISHIPEEARLLFTNAAVPS